jgi:hypothetical protein
VLVVIPISYNLDLWILLETNTVACNFRATLGRRALWCWYSYGCSRGSHYNQNPYADGSLCVFGSTRDGETCVMLIWHCCHLAWHARGGSSDSLSLLQIMTYRYTKFLTYQIINSVLGKTCGGRLFLLAIMLLLTTIQLQVSLPLKVIIMVKCHVL